MQKELYFLDSTYANKYHDTIIGKYDNKFYFHGQTVRKRNGWKLSERKEMIVNNILGVYLSSCFFAKTLM